MATHLKILGKSGKIILMKKSGKFLNNNQSQEKVRGNEIVLQMCFENVDIARFISIFCQKTRAINFTFCYTSDKF